MPWEAIDWPFRKESTTEPCLFAIELGPCFLGTLCLFNEEPLVRDPSCMFDIFLETKCCL